MSSADTQESQTPVRTYLECPSQPHIALPKNACDSHVHVFGPTVNFPYSTERKITPVEAPKEKLFALHKQLGIDRCVIVQSVIHGFDNRVVEDAIQAGKGCYLGIALVPITVTDLELLRLAEAGFRGVRFNFMRHLSNDASIQQVLELTPRLKAVGMHLQVHFESSLIHELGPLLALSQVPVVIDHMARVDARKGIEHEDFQALLRLLENRLFNVKVSGIDRVDAHVDPTANANTNDRYLAGIEVARCLVNRYPEQAVWGTDWPHPNHTHIPDDGVLVDALARLAPDQKLLEQVLVINPQRIYQFVS
ncbi:amidohydrolase family protein [Zwartia sp.]|uniref:amidohydrolase family protein n=1 Tax=Zwartia sp. TaxID=2978004 RepID=UPI0027261607|nr:amidohydrolase family protein [Zwartia sp.]MDO9024265.1 amidohydrolase family protein [Zwartia sp.]